MKWDSIPFHDGIHIVLLTQLDEDAPFLSPLQSKKYFQKLFLRTFPKPFPNHTIHLTPLHESGQAKRSPTGPVSGISHDDYDGPDYRRSPGGE